MPYRILAPDPVAGAGDAVQLPANWTPFAATVDGEWFVVLMYREVQ